MPLAFGAVLVLALVAALVLLSESSSPPEPGSGDPRPVRSPVLGTRPPEPPPLPLAPVSRPAAPEPEAEPRPENREENREEKVEARRPALDARPDPAALRDKLGEVAGDYPGRYGVVVLDPDSRSGVSLAGDDVFTAASIGKLPALITLYRAAARGDLSLDDEISIRPEDIQNYGTGTLRSRAPGTMITLRECAYYLMKKSDNTAWVMLDRHLGKEKVQAEIDGLGAASTDYYAVTTTPEDVLLMLEKIEDPSFTSEGLSKEMLAAMTDTDFEDRIPASLPPGTRVAHKIGSYEDSFGDAGVVFYKDRTGAERRYFIVVLSGGTAEGSARAAMQQMSRAAYEALAVPRQ